MTWWEFTNRDDVREVYFAAFDNSSLGPNLVSQFHRADNAARAAVRRYAKQLGITLTAY